MDVVAADGVNGPGRGLHETNLLDINILAVIKADELGTGILDVGLGEILVAAIQLQQIPPELTLAVQSAAAGNGNIAGILSVNAGHMYQTVNALPTGHYRRIFLGIGGEQQLCTGLEMQLHVVIKLDCTGQEGAEGNIDHAAAGLLAVSNGIGDCLGAAGNTVTDSTVSGDIKNKRRIHSGSPFKNEFDSANICNRTSPYRIKEQAGNVKVLCCFFVFSAALHSF